MKILHSADWHLCSPLQGRTPEQSAFLRRELSAVPEKIAALCKKEQCDLMLLSGDIFDGPCTAGDIRALQTVLEDVGVPVFIAPGNHDFAALCSPWTMENWGENIHIFTKNAMESVALPHLDCRVYGAAFTAMDCPGLLEGFTAAGTERWQIGVLHGDPTQTASPYCPITGEQIQSSGLQYLALGHIHKGGSLIAGDTLCAWPGCPMGRGYDEPGEKGVLIVTVEDTVRTRFVPLDTPRFHDLPLPVGGSPESALLSVLPPVGNNDFYRITLTGESQAPDLAHLRGMFSRFPNLELRDRTTLPVDPWRTVGEDSFEGAYFTILQQAMDGQDESSRRMIALAAKISRKILDGMEVELP